MTPRRIERLTLLTLLTLAGCGSEGDDDTSNAEPTTTQDTTSASDSATPGSTDDGTPVTDGDDVDSTDGTDGGSATDSGSALDCSDEMILDLGLVDDRVSEGDVTNTADGAGWTSTIDATAGGIVDAPQNPWIYLRFSPEGLQKVEVDDLEALESTDWDIAAKRFGLRLNGGVSGPSTVSAADLEGSSYEEITALPDGTMLTTETFYDESCTLLDDGSGQGSPSYRLTPWWTYPGCVATSAIPFVLELGDGNRVKLVVDSYYQSGQDECNATGAMGMGSANFSWRWTYLE